MAKEKPIRGKNGGKRPGAGGKKANKWDTMDMANRLDIVEGWARDGLTDLEMMELLHISAATFYLWKKVKPEFAEALRKGKDIVDRQVEKKLFEKATGISYVEQTKEPFLITDENGDPVLDDKGKPQYEMRVVKEVTKYLPPSDPAMIFWLKNRKPDKWRDKQQIEHSGAVGHVSLDHMTDEEIKAELKKYE